MLSEAFKEAADIEAKTCIVCGRQECYEEKFYPLKTTKTIKVRFINGGDLPPMDLLEE